MKCPKCRLINPDSAMRCDCGYDFISGILEEPYSKVIQKTKTKSISIPIRIVLLGFVLLWAYLFNALRHRSLFLGIKVLLSPSLIGGWIGLLLIPLIIAYLIAGWKSRRNWSSFTRWFFWLAFFAPLIGYSGESNEAKLERELNEIVPAFHNQVLQYNNKLQTLYSPESFSTRQNITGIIQTIKSLQKLNKVENMLSAFREKLSSAELSPEYREVYWEKFKKGFLSSVKEEKIYREAMWEWILETIGLYEFALTNIDQISVEEGEIFLAGSDLTNQFNEKIKKAVAAFGYYKQLGSLRHGLE